MPRPTRTIEIREGNFNEFLPADAAPEVWLVFTHKYDEYISDGVEEALTAEELVDLHRKVTLYISSVAGQQFLRDADIKYYAKVSTAPERHPEWDACRGLR